MKHLPRFAFSFLLLLAGSVLYGQAAGYDTTIVHQDGRVMRIRIVGNDTVFVATIPEVVVKAPRVFANDEEYRQYMRYRRYATDVLPYAIQSIKLYRQYQEDTEGMKHGKARKYAKEMQKDVKDDFTDQLKNMSRTQGKILVKMIERHLDTPMYGVLKYVRGGFTAAKWQAVGRLYGYDLKTGYTPGEDKILDLILGDFEINID
ncbi:MAG: DUF4294 domain-containing protein [Saprospiraceae bacterium]